MEVFEAIQGRRSVGKVNPDELPRETIGKLLDAAVTAPCHGMTEPWRFAVMTGEGRRKLGEAYARIAGIEDTANPETAPHIAKAFRAPVIIAVACAPSDRAKIVRIEEFAAVHAAVQNMLLAAHALGLGAIWRTGDPIYRPEMREALGFEAHEELVGLVYIGHPVSEPSPPKRTAAMNLTRWIER